MFKTKYALYLLVLTGLALAVFATGAPIAARPQPAKDSGNLTLAVSQSANQTIGSTDITANQSAVGFVAGVSARNDTSPRLRDIPPVSFQEQQTHQASPSRRMSTTPMNAPDTAVQASLSSNAMPDPILNFDGIPFPGVSCNCAPPDTNGEVGDTQYVQIVNEGLQVFDKTTGASELGPIGIETLWSGFGGVCEFNGGGDPVVLYDQIANRWVVSQFAGSSVPTDECVAVSTSSDATGNFYRYDFHLGSDFFDYPKLAVWPDAYYMGMNVFNAAGTQYLGPQPFALDRTAMLSGAPATFVTTDGPLSTSLGFLLPADLDGSNLPPAGAPDPWMGAAGATWPVYRFHVDFVNPANSTFNLAVSLTPDAYSDLCPSGNCVPQLGSPDNLDSLGDRPMFRLVYRMFTDGHEALVGNRSVASGGVGGIRWWEVIHATSGTPSFVQQSTYQPDTTWRWMGSIAMDTQGNIALGFSASSSSIYPQIRYAGRLATDPLNTLAQGETTLYAGTGSQTDTYGRWGDYSGMTVDPVDECTFWYTNEYYATTSSFNWSTRIGNFKFPNCSKQPDFKMTVTPTTQSICVPNPADYNVDLSSLWTFSQPVSLTVQGAPLGVISQFTPNPVVPPGTSTLGLDTSAGAAGSYNLVVVGSAITLTHAVTVGLNLYTSQPGVPQLLTPAGEVRNVSIRPTFTWQADQGAQYDIEVATDAAFTNIVVSASGLDSPSFTPGSDLPYNTVLYWRVMAHNTCGESQWSAASRFLTEATLGQCALGTTPSTLLSQDFESVNPVGWTTGGVGSTWVSSLTRKHSGTRSFKGTDVDTVSDQWLVSPSVVVPSNQNPTILSFWGYRKFQPSGGFDGGVVEVSTDGGTTWTALDSQLKAGPYDGTITSASNPLHGQSAWTTPKTSWINTIANLDQFAGQTVQFRFRLGTDNSIAYEGWYVDDVNVQSCMPSTALGPDSSQQAMPGDSVVHTFVLANQSTATDSFALSVSGNTWATALVSSSPITLTAGQTATVSVRVDVPLAFTSMSDSFTLSAASLGIPGITLDAMGETSLNIQPAAALSADQSGGGQAGQVVEYTFTVTNTGNFTDTFTLGASGTWITFLPDGTTTGPLSAGQTVTVTLLVAIPSDALVGDSDVTVLTTTSTLDISVAVTARATTVVFYQNYLPLANK